MRFYKPLLSTVFGANRKSPSSLPRGCEEGLRYYRPPFTLVGADAALIGGHAAVVAVLATRAAAPTGGVRHHSEDGQGATNTQTHNASP